MARTSSPATLRKRDHRKITADVKRNSKQQKLHSSSNTMLCTYLVDRESHVRPIPPGKARRKGFSDQTTLKYTEKYGLVPTTLLDTL